MKILSIIIPAYNEEKYITKLLYQIQSVDTEIVGFIKEIIVVDDGSTDQTRGLAHKAAIGQPRITVIHQDNQGKGNAVQRGVQEAKGDYVLVQDSDLEYDPNDYIPMLKCLINSRTSVYGSRTLGQIKFYNKKLPFLGRHPNQNFGAWLAGVFLTIGVFILYGRWITDTLTAYKIYPIDVIREMDIETHGFETDHEITAKLINNGIQIVEVPIKYCPRSFEEGKKIKMRDGFVAMWTFVRFRFKKSIINSHSN
jgi:dolichol-phosphate mannosyltransferase